MYVYNFACDNGFPKKNWNAWNFSVSWEQITNIVYISYDHNIFIKLLHKWVLSLLSEGKCTLINLYTKYILLLNELHKHDKIW